MALIALFGVVLFLGLYGYSFQLIRTTGFYVSFPPLFAIPALDRSLVSVMVYLVVVGLAALCYRALPWSQQAFLSKEVGVFRSLKIARGWSSRQLMRITWLDLVLLVPLFALFGYNAGIFIQSYWQNNDAASEWYGIPVNFWATTYHTAGEALSIALLLTLIPLSRNSFLTHWLGLSDGALLRYHQFLGNFALVALVGHILTFSNQLRVSGFYYFNVVLTIGRQIPMTWRDYTVPLAIGGSFSLLSLRLLSLPILRRRYYALFRFTHYFLAFTTVLFGCLHSGMVLSRLLPVLGLYGLDLVYRFYNFYFVASTAANAFECDVRLEAHGQILRLDVVGYEHAHKVLPGQFFSIQINQIDKYFSHPYSVASIQPTRLSFLIKPTGLPTSWTNQLKTLVQTTALEKALATKLSVCLDGPRCHQPFELERLDMLVCVVAGSGVASAIALAERAHTMKLDCHVLWSIRNYELASMSLFTDLEKQCPTTKITIFVTGALDLALLGKSATTIAVEDGFGTEYIVSEKNIRKGRIDAKAELEALRLEQRARVGLYLCGVQGFNESVEAAAAAYPNLVLYKETFEW
ncbi:hypothetical protein HDV03_000860 [Kappamyces sp. JEL0829]|nr:hypothetical protein HDV03_000860 [Kappamyces sp. JEL0829]